MSQTRSKHELICGAYGPRPTKAHRVCIFFPADEQKLRLIWLPVGTDGLAEDEAVNDLIAPETRRTEYHAAVGVSSDKDDEYSYR